MNLVRGLERRLERLLEGVAGRVFSGRLHPSEIAGRLAREADFARFDHETGPATANQYTLLVNPKDLDADPVELEQSLTEELLRYTTDQGLRLEGPCRVRIEGSDRVAPGSLVCHAEVVPGRIPAWAKLISANITLEVGHNRALVGRGEEADVRIPLQSVSRRHAVIWREGGRAFIVDLGSSNGTMLDGRRVGRSRWRWITGRWSCSPSSPSAGWKSEMPDLILTLLGSSSWGSSISSSGRSPCHRFPPQHLGPSSTPGGAPHPLCPLRSLAGQEIEITNVTVLGRSEEADVVLDDPYASSSTCAWWRRRTG